MREIKFRAWDKENKEMLINPNAGLVFGEPINSCFTDESVHYMQFTGLKDKNGVEIYEGDTLKRDSDRYYYSVHWGTTGFGLSVHREDGVFASNWKYLGEGEAGEVIGNIYENPELLEKES